MGYIAHQSITTLAQTNDYAITLREKNHYISFLRIEWLIIHKTRSLHTKIHCAKFGEITPVDLQKTIFKFCQLMYLCYFNYYLCYFINIKLPLEKGVALHLNKLEYSSLKNALCVCQFKFQISLMYFRCFDIISHWKRMGPFNWIILKLSPRTNLMICTKFGWNWPGGSGVTHSSMYFC